MYYNKIFNVWVLDALDCFLIGAFLGSIFASKLKNYLSEKASMARLKNDIIQESRLIKPSKSTNFDYKRSKIEKIYRFSLNTRGGQVDIEYQLAEQIQDVIIRLAVFLKKKELRAKVLKIIFTQGRLILQLVLHICKINLQYIEVGGLNPQIVVITCCSGGTAGFVFSWFFAGAILVAPPTILVGFFLRSLTQQILHIAEYRDFYRNLHRLLKDKDIQEEIKRNWIDAQKQVDNSNKIKSEYLNWNRNPEIKEAAERLGIFENAPNSTEKLNLDLLDADSNKILEELGILQNPDPFKGETNGKTVYFRDFIDEMVDNDNKSDLNVTDAEIVKEPIRVKIRDN